VGSPAGNLTAFFIVEKPWGKDPAAFLFQLSFLEIQKIKFAFNIRGGKEQ
jgi:hypothetical protein